MGQHRAAGRPGPGRLRRIGSVVGIALLSTASLLVAAPAMARTPEVGQVRLGHLSPSTPGVDIYLTAPGAAPSPEPLVQDAGYGAVTPYQSLATGRWTVEMRAAGAPADSPAPLSSALDITAGAAQSLFFFDTGAMGAVQGQVVVDDLAAAAPGTGRIRVVQGAPGDAAVDMQAAGGPRLATGLQYGTVTDYATVGARVWDVAVAAADEQLLASLDVTDGSVSTVVLTRDAAGALAVVPLVDRPGGVPTAAVPGIPELSGPPVAGPNEEAAPETAAPAGPDASRMPAGGVPAGGGATAGSADPAPVLLAVAGALLLVFSVSGRPLRRTRLR